MKKMIFLAVLALVSITAQAQEAMMLNGQEFINSYVTITINEKSEPQDVVTLITFNHNLKVYNIQVKVGDNVMATSQENKPRKSISAISHNGVWYMAKVQPVSRCTKSFNGHYAHSAGYRYAFEEMEKDVSRLHFHLFNISVEEMEDRGMVKKDGITATAISYNRKNETKYVSFE